MTENKKAEGKSFLSKLDQASADKGKLLELARDTIRESHNKLTFLGRKDLSVKSISLHIRAAFAERKANVNSPEFSSNDRLYMIMQKYVELSKSNNPKVSEEKALNDFCKDFAAAYPKEYGVKSEQRSADVQKAADKSKNIIPLLLRQSAQSHNIV